MAHIFDDITQTIGNTPLVRVRRMIQSEATVLAKLEFFNPLSSVKDRIGLAMIEAAEKSGQLEPGGEIIEPTSGNTGIALAFVCAARGYRLTLTMPESMSIERRKLLRALGAEIVLTPAEKGMTGAIERAERAARRAARQHHAAAVREPGQPGDPPRDHRRGNLARHRRPGRFPGRRASAPAAPSPACRRSSRRAGRRSRRSPSSRTASPVLSGGKPGPHKIQGIGAGFVPAILNTGIIDEVIQVSNEDAMAYARRAAQEEGLFVGISSGAALWAAEQIAKRPEAAGKTIVVIIPSAGERYLSTALFADIEV